MTRHVVARADVIGPGERLQITIGQRPVVVFNIDGEYFALVDICPHMGGRLSAGTLSALVTSDSPGTYRLDARRCLIRCPWHAWEFDVRSGKSYCDPERLKTRDYAITKIAGETLVEGPFEAEALEIEREGEYLVIDTR